MRHERRFKDVFQGCVQLLLPHWYLTPLPSLRGQKYGYLTVEQGCCQGFIPTQQTETCFSCVCVRGVSVYTWMQDAIVALQSKKRPTKYLVHTFPQTGCPQSAFLCQNLGHVCVSVFMCINVCAWQHAPCRLCYATGSELTWTWLSACLSYDRAEW